MPMVCSSRHRFSFVLNNAGNSTLQIHRSYTSNLPFPNTFISNKKSNPNQKSLKQKRCFSLPKPCPSSPPSRSFSFCTSPSQLLLLSKPTVTSTARRNAATWKSITHLESAPGVSSPASKSHATKASHSYPIQKSNSWRSWKRKYVSTLPCSLLHIALLIPL